MADSKPKYKKDLCMACPSQKDCLSIKMGLHCGNCKEALVCATREGLFRDTCAYIQGRWRSDIGHTCLLVSRFLNQKSEDQGPWVLSKHAICPRCEWCLPHVIKVTHRFIPPHQRVKFQGRRRLSEYVYRCENCSVDVKAVVT